MDVYRAKDISISKNMVLATDAAMVTALVTFLSLWKRCWPKMGVVASRQDTTFALFGGVHTMSSYFHRNHH
jgi:hypothetical protein